MDRNKITKIVLDSIKAIQDLSGDEYHEIELDSIPRDCLVGFDSLREEETIIIIKTTISAQLAKDIDFNKNIFYSKYEGAGSLSQVIENISDEILGVKDEQK